MMSRTMVKVRIVGIDPGTYHLGYGIIDTDEDNLKFVTAGALNAKRSESPEKRLHRFFGELQVLFRNHRPDICVVEKAFFGKSIPTAIRLGEARAVALICAVQAKLKVVEYSPAVVKKAVVGNGQADKSQVQRMTQAILRLAAPPQPLDAADALALALCHSHRLLGDTILISPKTERRGK